MTHAQQALAYAHNHQISVALAINKLYHGKDKPQIEKLDCNEYKFYHFRDGSKLGYSLIHKDYFDPSA
jgi:hypothetical protein